ncbi:MAG: hypothetical protein MAG451_00860 [Anaerolineales bacterium]|nr:hypothetical protein [Anaerolineales bacterium]
MGLLDKLSSLFSGETKDDAIHLYVQCDKCEAKLDIRVDKQYDLSPDIEGEGAYFLRKEMLDDKCFTLMYAEVHFDRQHNIIASDVEGGHLISREEYNVDQPA